MGIFQAWFRVGLVILTLLGSLAIAPGSDRFADKDEDEDSSSGRWEGVAMARLEKQPLIIL